MSGRNKSGEERKYLLPPRMREQNENPDTLWEITLSPTRDPTMDVARTFQTLETDDL